MKKDIFKVDFTVRDYECDLQGIVNNAVYQNYLEHARHLFLKKIGLDFANLTQKKIHLVVINAHLSYKSSLKPGDHFYLSVEFKKISPLKFVFFQNIYLKPENKLILAAEITGTSLNQKGRPQSIEYIDKIFTKYSS